MAPFIFSVIASPELLVCNELATYRKISPTCENVAPGVILQAYYFSYDGILPSCSHALGNHPLSLFQ